MKKYIKKIKFINDAYTRFKWREKKVSYGEENPEKIFYVIRRADSKVGLFSLVMTSLGYIKYALEQGYIPVVDMCNEDNVYMQQDRKGNVWEYYFEQPCGYSLEDIKKSKNIIIGNGLINGSVPYPDERIAYDEKELEIWKNIADKYLKIKNEILEETEMLAKQILGHDKILGVLLRGTDYVNSKPKNHPVQPNIEQAAEKIDEILAQKDYQKIYVATEDKNIYQKLCEKYGSRIVSMDVERYTTNGDENINDISVKRVANKYELGKEYLINILLLAKCDYLIAGNAGGSQGALLFRKKENEKYFFDLGKY